MNKFCADFYPLDDEFMNIDGHAVLWPKCKIEGCDNRCFMKGRGNTCYPHTKCECGAEKSGSNKHSDWCNKFLKDDIDEE